MRGKVLLFSSRFPVVWITPACAGKRGCSCRFHMPPGDHPRVCGEKNGICRAKVPHLGSPPRMRGKVLCYPLNDQIAGITPAYAGKRRPLPCLCNGSWDHPRVCGEKNPCSSKDFVKLGSPPRMRGKASSGMWYSLLEGITPACAGKRRVVPDCNAVRWDHPRVCGEKISGICRKCRSLGSPPRMRGKVVVHRCVVFDVGITPAYAGKRPSAGRLSG